MSPTDQDPAAPGARGVVLFDVDGVLTGYDGKPTPGMPYLIDVLRLLGFEVRFWSAGGVRHIGTVLQEVGIYGGFITHEKPTYPMTEEAALRIVGERPVLQIDDDHTERIADWPFMEWTPAAPSPDPSPMPSRPSR